MNNYKRSKIKEYHILNILRDKGYSAELLELFDNEGKELPQTYTVSGYKKSAPDINVYESYDKKEVILRIEVKGFEYFPKIKNTNLLGVEYRKFKHYVELLFLSEVETKIIFVVGKVGEENNYEYYWETLDRLAEIRNIRKDFTFDGLVWDDFIFWNPKDLNYGLEDFC
jgi:hypothetical protein